MKTRSALRGAIQHLEPRCVLDAVPFSELISISQPFEARDTEVRATHLADLDGDQDLDLLQIRNEFQTPWVITWRFNDGQGNFGPESEQQFGDGFNPRLADVNGDGLLDVVDRVDGMFVWHANAIQQSGQFQSEPQDITSSVERSLSAIADLNGDGRDDLVVSNWAAAQAKETVWIESRASGEFSERSLISLAQDSSTRDVVVFDIDGDANLDVVHISDTIDVIENLGPESEDSEFAKPVFVGWDWSFPRWRPPVPFDIDSDGSQDLVFSGGRSIYWIQNVNGGLLEPQELVSLSFKEFFPDPSVQFRIDANGDGVDELIWGGIGDLAWWSELRQPEIGFSRNELWLRHLATGDIDGDGDRDWLGSDSLGELIVWYDGLSEGTLTDPQFVASRELDRATDLQLLDFEGDGDLDVLLQLGETLVWYENLGGGDYAPLSELLDLESEWTETYQLIDLTGDVQLDLTYSILSENFMRVQKERQFGEEVELPFGGTANYVDIDGDSNVDLAIASLNDSRVHFNDGLGNFGEANPLPNVNASELLVADFDGDGDQDLIGSVVGLGTLEQIKLYENTQAGYRVEHIAAAPDGRFVFGIYEDMQLADADGDGDQDLFLLGESQSGSGVFGGFSQPIEVFENRMGQFVPAISVTSRDSLGRRSFELADLDSNGLVDIAVVIKPIGDDGIAYFENTFDQTSTISFENRRAVFPGQSLAIGDVDDDGKPDLVVLTQDGNRLGWFRSLSEQGNRVVTPIDIDNLWNAIRSDSNEDRYDWNDDGFVNNVDVDHLVEDVLGTRSGDMDLNGRVDFFDFLSFARNFGEEGLGWGGVDFDGDGTVGFRDFLALAENFLFNIS